MATVSSTKPHTSMSSAHTHSTVLFVCALLLLVCGFVLDTVAKKHRQLFEINLNMLNMLHHKGDAE